MPIVITLSLAVCVLPVFINDCWTDFCDDQLENGKWKVDGYLKRDLLVGANRQHERKDRDEGQHGERNYEHVAEEQRLPL